MRKAKFLKTGEIVNIHNIDYCGNGQDYATIEKDEVEDGIDEEPNIEI